MSKNSPKTPDKARLASARERALRNLADMTAAEDAAITADALKNPDNPPAHANIALRDNFAKTYRKTRGTVDPALKLGF
jgi:hypothetical protein